MALVGKKVAGEKIWLSRRSCFREGLWTGSLKKRFTWPVNIFKKYQLTLVGRAEEQIRSHASGFWWTPG